GDAGGKMDRTIHIESPAGLGHGDERFARAIEVFRYPGLQTEGYPLLKRGSDLKLFTCDLDMQKKAPSFPRRACARGSPNPYYIVLGSGTLKVNGRRHWRTPADARRTMESAATPGIWRQSGARYLCQMPLNARRSGRRTGPRPGSPVRSCP